MDNNIDNIDDLFREGFADYAETPPPAVWQAVERRLDNDKRRRAFPLMWFWYIGILIVAVVLGAGMGMLYMPESGKEMAVVATAPDMLTTQLNAHETVANTTTSKTETVAAHTLPAQKEETTQLQKSTNTTTQQGDVKEGNAIADNKHKKKGLKGDAKRKTNLAQTKTIHAGNTAQNTSPNAAATGTSMYSYDDFEEEVTTEDKQAIDKGTQQVEAGYVVSKKRKNSMVVVEQLPENVAAEERKNTNKNEGISSGVSMKGKGVQIAKASTGNVADVPGRKRTNVTVTETAVNTEPKDEQGIRTGEAGSEGAAIATREDDKRVEHVAATNNKVGNKVSKKRKIDRKKVTANTTEQQRVAVQNKLSTGKTTVVAASKRNEKMNVTTKVIAGVTAKNKKVAKANVNATPIDVASQNGVTSSNTNVATSSNTIAAKSEAASIANNKGKGETALVKNTGVKVAAVTPNTIDAKSSKELTNKRKVAQQKQVAVNESGGKKVATRHTATAEKTVATKNVVAATVSNEGEKKTAANRHSATAEKTVATKNVVATKVSNEGEKKTAAKNDKAVAKNATIAARNNKKNASVNSEVSAISAARKMAADKKVIPPKVVNGVPKKEEITGNEKAENEKVKIVGANQNIIKQHTSIGEGNKNKKQPKKYGDVVTTKNTEKAVKGTTPSHTIAAKTPTGKAKQTTGNKQKGVAKSEEHGAETAMVNATSPAISAKSRGGKQGGVAGTNISMLAAGKWSLDNSLPEETTAADYVMKKEINPVLHAFEIVVEATNKTVDTTFARVIDSAVTTTVDSVKNDTTTHKKRFVLGVKAGVETGMMAGAANKAVVSPYLQYKFSERLSLMMQPALKMAGLSTRNVGNATNYYDVTQGTGSYKLTDSALLILVLTGDTLWNRNYEYTERYDSVVKTNKTGGNYMEIELPLLLQYKLTKRLSVYGGVNTVYGKKMGVTEHTYVAKAMPKIGYVNTLAQYYAPAPAPTGTGTTYTGSPLSGYSGPQYPSETGGMFRFGYMFGLSYEVRKRWLADILVQQCIAQQNLVAGYDVNKPFSVPYFRLTVGYRLSK